MAESKKETPTHKVVEVKGGNTHSTHTTEAFATAAAKTANEKAEQMGLAVRYEVTKF